eukprot:gene27690-34452_t
MSISQPDPSQIDKYSQKFALNLHNEGKMRPTGFFRKVPKDRGRERLKQKLGPFLNFFEEIQAQLTAKLETNGISKGDDVVVMVVNEGEIDLFLNFACSCKLHDISLKKVLVFAGSSEIIPLIEATGAMGLYHIGYAAVSRRASVDYLDRVFVDMMWYKTFSVWLLLRRGINILFQDADLIWFRDPMQYFHDYVKDHQARSDQTGSHPEAFFSDDGQRSMRYTPFYANSGFYFLLSGEKSIYFTWSIMTAMDSIQVLGSHQNVFTTKLIEGLSINTASTKILSLIEFPTGIMYHHNRAYMKSLRDKEIHPYGFHMCWTQGKPDKLINLRKALMWYLTEECSPLEAITAADERQEGSTDGPGLQKLLQSVDTGAICLDILKDQWSPALTMKTALLSLQALLCSPEPNDPQDAVVANQYKDKHAEFLSQAKFWTETYAKAPGAEQQMHPVLKKLIDMGFPEDVSRKALLDSHGDENAAVEILLSSM